MADSQELDKIRNNVNMVRYRKYICTVFGLESKAASEDRFVEFFSIKRNIIGKNVVADNEKVRVSKIEEKSVNGREIPSVEFLKSQFEEIRNEISEDKCYYIVCDFGFYNDLNAYRTLLCLITYIPDDVADVSEKFTYSKESLLLQNLLNIGKPIVVNNWKSLEYENIASICSGFTKY
ncbi:hypothetical protein EDEG_01670 [Edhazardia aedis USNM 41457]|uniref:ADF-H domain-containing protein n=1 Tax=Edhazardia aedis (strain USNM 41457) TaxID=1003232 RepID=J9D8D3_EDHAE|nr:hypothetical protein EDEG_01670 [Edhazardia aedis USNM 41457]|eukprot:EJW04036.1 hypothetical protein EDEG_01670 [Edhazardia aedis USNM 41457]